MASLGDLVVRITGDNSDFDKTVNATEKRFTDLAKTLSNVGKKLTTFVTLPIVGIGLAAVKSAADMEMQQAAFETMLGSAKAAQRMLTDLKDLAARTPFQLGDLANAGKTLLQFGVEADEVLPTIRRIGDVAQGNSDRFSSLALAFGQVQSTGRLMGQDLLQMVNAGFNPLQQISEQTGESMADLKAAMEDGAISAEMVADAFQAATEEGGRFFGGMERASQTLGGQFSTLMDNVAELGRSFAQVLLPPLKDIIGRLTAFAQRFANLDETTKRMILTIAGLVAAVGPLALVVGKAIPIILAFNAAIAANPIGALAIAVGAVTAGIVLYLGAVERTRRAQEELNTAMETGTKRAESLVVAFDNATVVQNAKTRITELQSKIADLRAEQSRTIDVTGYYNKEISKLEAEIADLTTTLDEYQKRADSNLEPGIDTRRYEASIKAIEAGFATVAEQTAFAAATGETYNAVAERGKVVADELAKLRTENFAAESANVKQIIKDYKAYTAEHVRVAEAQQAIAAGLAQVDQQAKLAARNGEEYNAVAERRRVILAEVNALIEEGYRVEKDAGEEGITHIQALLAEHADLLEAYEDEIEALKEQERIKAENAARTEEYIASLQRERDAEKARETAAQAASATRRQFYLQQYKNSDQAVIAIDEEMHAYIAAGVAVNEALEWATREKAKIRNEEHDAEMTRLREWRDRYIGSAQMIVSQVGSLFSALTDRRVALLAREQDVRDRFYADELTEAEKRKESGLQLLDDQLAAELERQGVAEATKAEQIAEKIRETQEAKENAAAEALDTTLTALQRETAAERVAALASELIELDKSLRRETIIADFEAKRTALLDAADAERDAIEDAAEKEKDERDARARAAARKQAAGNKAFALFDIAIRTAQAIMAALAEGKKGIPLAIAAGIAGAAQAGIVAAQPLPELAEGGIAMPRPGGVVATVAEAGQPEVIFPLDRLEEFLSQRPTGRLRDEEADDGSEGDINLVVNLDAAPILKTIFPATRNRTVLIDAAAVVGG